jgi:hypothetical protein
MRKKRIKLLNNKYIVACHTKINEETKVFYVHPVEYHWSREYCRHWVVKPCSSEERMAPAPAGFLLGLLFDPEYGGDTFLRNVGFSHNYKALQPRTAARNSDPAVQHYMNTFLNS